MNVVFDVSGKLYPLDEQAATVTGENLRRKAAGQLGDEGVEGARGVADEIERVLVGTSSEPNSTRSRTCGRGLLRAQRQRSAERP